MANTYVDYTAVAAQTDFAFTFPYLEDEHVVVEIDGSATTAFSIVTTPSTKIVLDSGATAGQKVRVRRKSQPDTDLVDFENGSVLTESELDRAYLHNRYLNEEIGELNDASLQKAVGTNDWDAQNSKIINVADPTDTTDASTKLYVDNKVNQVLYGSDAPLKWQFTGTAGTNTTYTVTGAEISGDTVYDVSINGLVQEPTVDYTVNPDTDTLTIKTTLAGGEDIVIIQRGFGVAIKGIVGSNQLVNGAVTTEKIADGAVTTAKIGADAVNGSKIADDSIDSEHYVDGSIDTAYIADGAVTSGKISTTDAVFNIQSDGKVGIGTSNPGEKLQVHGTIISVANNIEVSNGGSAHGQGMYSPGENELGFSTASIERIRIDDAGNVGIGTNGLPNTSAKLDVSGTTGGILFPRLTTTERGFLTPTNGLVIYNISAFKFQGYAGGSWVDLH